MKQQRSQAGFSFIEIIVVVVIIGILATVVVQNVSRRPGQAQVNAAWTQISVFESQLDAYQLDVGDYPTTEQGLEALVTMVPGLSEDVWMGPYLRRGVPSDPWGNPYGYRYPGTRNTRSYDLFSRGPDQQEGGDDDITNW